MRVRLVGLIALMALVLASCGGASPEAGGPGEGIQVHGDWTIDIYNEDGTLDRNVEFSNALGAGGEELLAALLNGEVYPGVWGVELHNTDTAMLPCINSSGTTSCFIVEPHPVFSGEEESSHSQALEVRVQDGRLVLTGSHVASVDGEVNHVRTQLLTCSEALSRTECASAFDDLTIFTATELVAEDVAPVASGQTIQVEVDISFTSG